MLATDFDHKTAAGLHRDRLAEAESNRRARAAKLLKKEGHAPFTPLRQKLGKQLIALGERIAAA